MIFKAEELCIGYSKTKALFENISFAANEAEFIALFGLNGIGKSTLLRTISGLQKPVAGNVKVDGRNIHRLPVQERATLLSVVFTERPSIENISVLDFVSMGRMPYTGWLGNLSAEDKMKVAEITAMLKMDKLLAARFNNISDGEKQKALIARALCQQTPVIILDEPTAFLDFKNKKEILELLSSVCRQLNKIIILSTHDIDTTLEFTTQSWLMTERKEFIEIKNSGNYHTEIMSKLLA